MKSWKAIKEDWKLQKRVDKISPFMASNISMGFLTGGGMTAALGGFGLYTAVTHLTVYSVPELFFTGSLGAIGIFAGSAMTLLSGMGIKESLRFLKKEPSFHKIEEVENAAGQTVKGPRWALSLLGAAQSEINQLTKTFNTVAPSAEQRAQLQAVIDAAKPLQKEITVIKPGDKGAGSGSYEFLCEVTENIVITRKATTMLKDSAGSIGSPAEESKLPMLPITFINGPER